MSSINLTDRHIVITGASRGLGRALAQAFYACGSKVSLFARAQSDIELLARALGSNATFYAGDICQASDHAAALAHFRTKHGPIDILVNNAGIGTYEPFLSNKPVDIQATINTNLTGLILLTHAVAQEMVGRGSGHLVHVASDLGRRPLANMAVYAAAKHGVVGFSQSLARELRAFGVKSTVITPGMIDTFFGGNTEGSRGGPGVLSASEVADLIVEVVSKPAHVLIDEVAVHALGQDF